MHFHDKIVLVTGASRGIGAACAYRFAQAGAKVIVHYLHNLAAAEGVAQSIRAEGGEVALVQADLAELTHIDRFVDTAAQAFGGLHILVNNAGIAKVGTIDTVEPEQFHHQFNLNVGSVLFVTKAAARSFDSTGGAVVNISSINGSRPVSGASIYSATKAAVEVLTKSLAIELAPQRIRVNAVAPGITDTDLLRSILTPDVEAQVIA
jgi:3-oxoacyl-[acyl-carrier protein] reductase